MRRDGRDAERHHCADQPYSGEVSIVAILDIRLAVARQIVRSVDISFRIKQPGVEVKLIRLVID